MAFILDMPSYPYTVERRSAITPLREGIVDGQHLSTSWAILKTHLYPVPSSICLLPILRCNQAPGRGMTVIMGLPYKYEVRGVLKGHDLQGSSLRVCTRLSNVRLSCPLSVEKFECTPKLHCGVEFDIMGRFTAHVSFDLLDVLASLRGTCDKIEAA